MNKQSAIAASILLTATPVARRDLMSDPEYVANLGLRLTPTVELYPDITLSPDDLHQASKDALSNLCERVPILTRQGTHATIHSDADGTLHLKTAEMNFILPDSRFLSDNLELRLTCVAELAQGKLPSSRFLHWKAIAESGFSQSDSMEFYRDIQNTPLYSAEYFGETSERGTADWPELVPSDYIYAERLVGPRQTAQSLSEFVNQGVVSLHQSLPSSSEIDRLKLLLCSCGHLEISKAVTSKIVQSDCLAELASWVAERASPIALVGLLEALLTNGTDRLTDDTVSPQIISLLETFVQSDPSTGSERYKVASRLILAVDGYMAQSKLWLSDSVFYRRFFASTQSAVMQSFYSGRNADLLPISDTLFKSRAHSSVLRSLVDMDSTPRWTSNGLSEDVLYAEHAGRIMNAASALESAELSASLRDLLFGSTDSVKSKLKPHYSFVPGFLEGDAVPVAELPEGLKAAIVEQLTTRPVTKNSFIALCNATPLFSVSSDILELAKSALNTIPVYLDQLEEDYEIWAILSSIASLAALYRDEELAERLGRLSRRYVQSLKFSLEPQAYVHICVSASAAFKEPASRKDWLAKQVEFLAFSERPQHEYLSIAREVEQICTVAPDYWGPLAKAKVAISTLSCSSGVF